MKERDTRGKNVKSKGFYIALYSCIGVMLLIAVVIGYQNLTGGAGDPGNQQQAQLPPVDINEGADAAPVGADEDPVSDDFIGDIGTPFQSGDITVRKPLPTPAATPAPSEGTTSEDTTKASETPTASEEAQTLDTPEESDESAAEPEEDPAELTEAGLEDSQEFTAFEDQDTMLWPVLGEIVMDFSTDALVYDKTLEQYRTNDSVCISAPSGTQVRAAAEGLVVAVETSKELGNTVVVEHGNGWVTTYSQLQDNILVSVGDVVESGQIIGGVGEPSIYSALLGSHLNFVVSKDDVPVNPNDILASS